MRSNCGSSRNWWSYSYFTNKAICWPVNLKFDLWSWHFLLWSWVYLHEYIYHQWRQQGQNVLVLYNLLFRYYPDPVSASGYCCCRTPVSVYVCVHPCVRICQPRVSPRHISSPPPPPPPPPPPVTTNFFFFFFKELYFTTYIAGTTQYNAFLWLMISNDLTS